MIFIGLFFFNGWQAVAQDHLVLSDKGSPWIYFTEIDNIFYKTVANEAFLEIDKREAAIQKIATQKDVENRIATIKERFKEVVGEFPQKTPLNPKVLGVIEKDFYTIEKIVFESRPNFFVTSVVYKPKKPSKKKLPAILYLSGHSDVAFRSATYQKTILNLVKKGFLVMGIDPIGQGERKEILEREMPFDYGKNTLQHSYIGSQCLLAGSSFIKYMIWDGIRAIDYLATRKDVDMDNIGATGRSGGGTQTAWLGVFEERLKATVIENYITTFKRLIQSIGFQDAEQNVNYGLANGLDFADLVLARAPKPTLIITTEADFFNIQGAIQTYEEAKRLYTLLGVEENVSWHTDVAGHASTPKNREKLYDFFLKNLSSSQKPMDDEIPSIPPDSLVVLNEDYKGRMFETTVHKINMQEYLTAKKELFINDKKIDYSFLQKNLGIKWNNGKAVKTKEIQLENYAIEKFFIDHAEYPLPFILLKPNGNSHQKVLTYYSPKGKEALYDEKIVGLVNKGYTLILVDMLGIGELGKGDYGGGSSAKELNPDGIPPNIWFMSNQTQRSILGIWLADMRRISQFVETRFPNYQKHIWATDYLSIPALHLSKLLDDNQRIGLHDLLYSWGALITHKFYDIKWLLTTLPAITFKYDIVDLLKENTTIQVSNFVNAESEILILSELKKLNESEMFQKVLLDEKSDKELDDFEGLTAFLNE